MSSVCDVDGNIVSLYAKDATITDNTYYWIMDFSYAKQRKIRFYKVAIPFSWYLFTNEILLNTLTGSPVLNGNWDILTLPAQLATLLGATVCSIPLSTRKISLTFAGAVTLNISSWSKRARYFLGAGDNNIVLAGPGTITFPNVVDLGGDVTLNIKMGIFNNRIIEASNSEVKNTFKVMINGNPSDWVIWEPYDLYFLSSPLNSSQALSMQIYDIWGNFINFNNGNFFMEYRLED